MGPRPGRPRTKRRRSTSSELCAPPRWAAAGQATDSAYRDGGMNTTTHLRWGRGLAGRGQKGMLDNGEPGYCLRWDRGRAGHGQISTGVRAPRGWILRWGRGRAGHGQARNRCHIALSRCPCDGTVAGQATDSPRELQALYLRGNCAAFQRGQVRPFGHYASVCSACRWCACGSEVGVGRRRPRPKWL